MNQQERLDFLLRYLLNEIPSAQRPQLPAKEADKEILFRSLRNIRPPQYVAEAFLRVQDDYLKASLKQKKITSVRSLKPRKSGIYLWQGDITTFEADAIVNAANSALLGCFIPCHRCIDNAIHSAAGVQLRQECHQLMQKQGHEEPIGCAKITKGYNLPCTYVIHTVGPYVHGCPTAQDCDQLASCYVSCLTLAQAMRLKTLVFCCISTGEFHFPNDLAAEIAIQTVLRFQNEHENRPEVVFNVFKGEDYERYARLL